MNFYSEKELLRLGSIESEVFFKIMWARIVVMSMVSLRLSGMLIGIDSFLVV